MGELIRVHIPRCRVRDICMSKTAIMVGVFSDLKQAEESCKNCYESIQGHCPMSEPGILSLVAEDEPV